MWYGVYQYPSASTPQRLLRTFPIDMAGFAVNLRLILENSLAHFGRTLSGEISRKAHLETDFISLFRIPQEELECMSDNKEV